MENKRILTLGEKAAEAELKKDPKRAHIRAALLRVHPFLRLEHRKLEKKELKSVKVFGELFPKAIKPNNKETVIFILAAIYEFQK